MIGNSHSIGEMSQGDHGASGQRESDEVLESLLMSHQKSPVVLKPRNRPLHHPPVFVAAQLPGVLSPVFRFAVAPVGSDHINAKFRGHGVRRVRVIGFVADQPARRGGHVVKPLHGLLDELRLTKARAIKTRRERNSLGINANLDFRALALACQADSVATTLGGRKGGVDKTLLHVKPPAPGQLSDNKSHDPAEHVVGNPYHQVVVDRGFRRKAPGEVLPLDSGVEHEKDRFENSPRVGTRSAPFGFLWDFKVGPDGCPLFVGQKHMSLLAYLMPITLDFSDNL